MGSGIRYTEEFRPESKTKTLHYLALANMKYLII